MSKLVLMGVGALAVLILVSKSLHLFLFSDEISINRRDICSDLVLIDDIQRIQISKAKESIFGSVSESNFGKQSNMKYNKHSSSSKPERDLELEDQEERRINTLLKFYRRSFGAIDVHVTTAPRAHDSLVYHRIFKNANNFIRIMLYKYAFMAHDRMKRIINLNCDVDECLHPDVHVLNPHTVKTAKFPRDRSRFDFTFVREPISRFISAITEIEYRAKLVKQGKGKVARISPAKLTLTDHKALKAIDWPLEEKLGTQHRFQELVRLLLNFVESPKVFSEFEGVELQHLAPMVGTIVLNNNLLLNSNINSNLLGERTDTAKEFHLYHIEDFEREWFKFVNESGVKALEGVYKYSEHKGEGTHPSSDDPDGVAFAARSFLSYAGGNAYNTYWKKWAQKHGGNSSSSISISSSATTTTTTTGTGTADSSFSGTSTDDDGLSISSASIVNTTVSASATAAAAADDEVSSVLVQPLAVPEGKDLIEHQEEALKYMRALCRLYLMDYVCADYELPDECKDMQADVNATSREYFAQKAITTPETTSDLLRLLLPARVLHWIASWYCMLSRGPACMAEFMHGKEVMDEDDWLVHFHEEL